MLSLLFCIMIEAKEVCMTEVQLSALIKANPDKEFVIKIKRKETEI